MKNLISTSIRAGLFLCFGAFVLQSTTLHAQFSSGWVCNRTNTTIHLASSHIDLCKEMVNGTQVTALCGKHTGWAHIASGSCTGVTGGQVLFGSGGYIYAYGDDGSEWQGNGGDGYTSIVCASKNQSWNYLTTAIYSDASGQQQYIRNGCTQGNVYWGIESRIGAGAPTMNLLPGGQHD